MNEVWLQFDHPDDEDAAREANVTLTDTGYQVAWYHTAVGVVSSREFDTLTDAYDFLERWTRNL